MPSQRRFGNPLACHPRWELISTCLHSSQPVPSLPLWVFFCTHTHCFHNFAWTVLWQTGVKTLCSVTLSESWQLCNLGPNKHHHYGCRYSQLVSSDVWGWLLCIRAIWKGFEMPCEVYKSYLLSFLVTQFWIMSQEIWWMNVSVKRQSAWICFVLKVVHLWNLVPFFVIILKPFLGTSGFF